MSDAREALDRFAFPYTREPDHYVQCQMCGRGAAHCAEISHFLSCPYPAIAAGLDEAERLARLRRAMDAMAEFRPDERAIVEAGPEIAAVVREVWAAYDALSEVRHD